MTRDEARMLAAMVNDGRINVGISDAHAEIDWRPANANHLERALGDDAHRIYSVLVVDAEWTPRVLLKDAPDSAEDFVVVRLGQRVKSAEGEHDGTDRGHDTGAAGR